MTDDTAGPIFRANKRRKVIRKRPDSDDNDNDATPAPASGSGEQDQSPTNASNTEPREDDGSTQKTDVSRMRKPKRHGIAFSSSDRATSRPQDHETALVVAEPQSIQEQNSRFARQTGKAIVQDDKHMSAYIDSKLAEMRSAATTPSSTNQPSNSTPEDQASAQPSSGIELGIQAVSPTQTTSPTQPVTQHPPSRRRGKKGRAPSPSSQARASLIDQIMRESNHTPHYTAPAASAQPRVNDASDPDAAAAAAFKAEFLAQAELRSLSRRQPATNSSTKETTSSGPKLGGSRAQRERMRAAEEAKGKK
ncbi:hypothetical protein Q7P37_006334 [Cladosporium fusiforme]